MVGDVGFEPDVVCDENRATPLPAHDGPMSPEVFPHINPDRPRIAYRLLSKVGDDAQPTQASPTWEHVVGLFGPDCKRMTS
jgi:hypothetical protein